MLDLQKAALSKRISAFLFDLIMFFIVVVGVGCIVNPAVGYDAKVDQLEAIYDEYSEKYGIDTELTQEQFNEMTKEEQDAYNARVEEANAALNEDKEALELYHDIIVLLLFNVTVSTLVAYLALEFAIPLLLGNGQTLGKKIFGVALMRADGVKVRPVQMFVRSILGKFTLETMIPVLVIGMIITNVTGSVGIIVLLAIAILEVFVYFKSGTNSLIHDLVAVTVCIDLQSQLIFETEEELIAYKEKTAAENVGKMGQGKESSVNVYSSVNSIEVNSDGKVVTDSVDHTDSRTEFSSISLGTISIGDETYVNTAVSTAEVEDKRDETPAPDREEETHSDEEPESIEESEKPENTEESEEAEATEDSEENGDSPEETESEEAEDTEETDEEPEAEDGSENTEEA